MKISKQQKYLSAFLLCFSINFSQLKSIDKHIPPTVGIAASLTALAGGLALVKSNTNNNILSYSDAGLKAVVCIGSFLFGGALYALLRRMTPYARYKVAKEVVRNFKHKFENDPARQAKNSAELTNIQNNLELSLEELRTGTGNDRLHEKVQNLLEDVLEIYLSIARYSYQQGPLYDSSVSGGIFVEQTKALSEKEYISHVLQRVQSPNWLTIILNNGDEAEKFITRACKLAQRVIDIRFTSNKIQEFTAQAHAMIVTFAEQKSYIEARIQLMRHYKNYKNAKRALDNVNKQNTFSFDLDAHSHLSDGMFLENTRQLFDGNTWYVAAFQYYQNLYSGVESGVEQLSKLLERGHVTFADDIEFIYQEACNRRAFMQPRLQLLKRNKLYHDAEQTLLTLYSTPHIGGLLKRNAHEMTDGEIWAWCQSKYTGLWYKKVKRELEKLASQIDNVSTALSRDLAKDYRTSLDDYCKEKVSKLKSVGKDIQIKLWLVGLYPSYKDIKQLVEKELASILFYPLIEQDMHSVFGTNFVAKLKSFYAGNDWPLIAAEKDFNNARTHFDDVMVQAKKLKQKINKNVYKRYAHKIVTLIKEVKKVHDILEKYELKLRKHPDYLKEVAEKSDLEKYLEQAEQVSNFPIAPEQEPVTQPSAPSFDNDSQNNDEQNNSELKAECPICFDEFEYDDTIAVMLCCGQKQIMHVECFKESMASDNRHPLCPLCRSDKPRFKEQTYREYSNQAR